jgi:hypothetical protein
LIFSDFSYPKPVRTLLGWGVNSIFPSCGADVMLFSWFRKRPVRRPLRATQNAGPPAQVEMLETRQLLSAFAVTNAQDNGNNANPIAGSLRDAIIKANQHAGPDQIKINIPGSAFKTIHLQSALPLITDSVDIDGSGGASGPRIGIDGSAVGSGNGLEISAPNCSIRNLVIEDFANGWWGIAVQPFASGTQITSCKIGTNETGLSTASNSYGVLLQGDGAQLSGNLISGNLNDGVMIMANNCTLQGNKIGVDISGEAALGNGGDGVVIMQGVGNHIGTTTGKINLISGNGGNGVVFDATNANYVQHNFIGTDQTGLTAIFNSGDGVLIQRGSSQNLIGGNSPGAANLISGNLQSGVEIHGDSLSDNEGANFTADASQNKVYGNIIGLDLYGMVPVPNVVHGVDLNRGANQNLIGGTGTYERNTISGNGASQVEISGAGTIQNVVQHNFIGLSSAGKLLSGGQSLTAGVSIDKGGSQNEVGGPVTGTGNVIGGLLFGIEMTGSKTTKNNVDGNYIGLDESGKHAAANDTGILLSGVVNDFVGAQRRNVISGNVIGIDVDGGGADFVESNLIGTDKSGLVGIGNQIGVRLEGGTMFDTVEYNTISGNANFGVLITGAATQDSIIWGNTIGLNSAGAALGNGRHGIFITNGASKTLIGGGGNISNVIADNGIDGVLIGSDPSIGYNTPAGNGNNVQVNSIYGNGKLGIDLGPNDGLSALYFGAPADPNDQINRPVITSASLLNNGTLRLTGEFYSPVDTDITVLVYSNPAGTSQGRINVGGFYFHANAGVITTFSHDIQNSGVAPGMVITLTASNNQDSTSEFSTGVKAQLNPKVS